MSEGGSTKSESWLGRFLRGILKLTIGGFVLTLITQIPINDVSINGNTLPISTIGKLIVGIAPVYLIISGLHDIGVDI